MPARPAPCSHLAEHRGHVRPRFFAETGHTAALVRLDTTRHTCCAAPTDQEESCLATAVASDRQHGRVTSGPRLHAGSATENSKEGTDNHWAAQSGQVAAVKEGSGSPLARSGDVVEIKGLIAMLRHIRYIYTSLSVCTQPTLVVSGLVNRSSLSDISQVGSARVDDLAGPPPGIRQKYQTHTTGLTDDGLDCACVPSNALTRELRGRPLSLALLSQLR